MAVSKKVQRSSSTPPDPMPFLRLLDDGLAEPVTVAKAYDHVLREWSATAGPQSIEPGDIAQERSLPDPDTPKARIIRLLRDATLTPTEEDQ